MFLILHILQVHFAYVEAGEKKAALVKVRLCPPCGEKLNYKRNKEKKKEARKRAREEATEERKETGEQRQQQGEDDGVVDDDNASSIPPNKKAVIEEHPPLEESQLIDKEKERERLAAKEAAIWQQKPTLEKTKEDEFDEYFKDMFP